MQAVEICPGYAPAFYNIAVVHSEAGRAEEAIGQYRAALAVAPGYAEAWCNLASSTRTRQVCHCWTSCLLLFWWTRSSAGQRHLFSHFWKQRWLSSNSLCHCATGLAGEARWTHTSGR